MSKKSLFAILIFALLCTGCENTLPLPDEYMRPLMVMNGLFTPDSLLESNHRIRQLYFIERVATAQTTIFHARF